MKLVFSAPLMGNRNRLAPAPEEGDTVLLIPEPKNEVDKSAVAVYNCFFEQLGYVRQRGNTSEYVAKLLNGRPTYAKISFKDSTPDIPIILMDIYV